MPASFTSYNVYIIYIPLVCILYLLQFILFPLIYKVNIPHQTTVYVASIRTEPDCLYLYVEIKCQLDSTEIFYCRSYCLLNIFRAPLCPSSGAQEYYTVVAACGISCCRSSSCWSGGAEGYVSGLQDNVVWS